MAMMNYLKIVTLSFVFFRGEAFGQQTKRFFPGVLVSTPDQSGRRAGA
jgi:hypothetical protein